jgi:hypothetical protein
VVSLPFFSEKSARLHFVPPTSPARITFPPVPLVRQFALCVDAPTSTVYASTVMN